MSCIKKIKFLLCSVFFIALFSAKGSEVSIITPMKIEEMAIIKSPKELRQKISALLNSMNKDDRERLINIFLITDLVHLPLLLDIAQDPSPKHVLDAFFYLLPMDINICFDIMEPMIPIERTHFLSFIQEIGPDFQTLRHMLHRLPSMNTREIQTFLKRWQNSSPSQRIRQLDEQTQQDEIDKTFLTNQ